MLWQTYDICSLRGVLAGYTDATVPIACYGRQLPLFNNRHTGMIDARHQHAPHSLALLYALDLLPNSPPEGSPGPALTVIQLSAGQRGS